MSESVEVDGFTVTSNTETAEEMRAALGVEEPEQQELPEAEPTNDEVVDKALGREKSATEPEPKVDKRTREGRRQSIQRELDELTAKRHTAKQEADAEEQRLAKLRADIAATQAAPPKPAAQPPAAPPQTPVTDAAYKRYMALPDAPKISDFAGETGWMDYQYAVSQFIADKRFDERLAQHQQQQRVAQEHSRFQTRLQEERKSDPTFDQKLNQTPVDERIIPYLHSHAQGPDVMVYLANNPALAQQITMLTPIEQVGKIGEIVAELKLRSEAVSRGPARPPAVSRATPPIKPLGGSPEVSADVDEGDLPVEQFIARGNKRDRAAGRF